MTNVASGNTSTRVTGGGKLKRYVASGGAVHGPQFARRFVRSFPLASLVSVLPKRTGALRRSMRIVQRGGNVELRGISYGKIVRWRIPADNPRRNTTIGSVFFRKARQTIRRGLV